MPGTKPNTVRIGATVLLVIVVALVLLWIIRGGDKGRSSATVATPETERGGRVSDHSAQQATVSGDDQRQLVGLARRTIEEVVRNGRLPEVDPAGLSDRLREKCGCFVTLEIGGQLRGCIGHIQRDIIFRATVNRDPQAGSHGL